MNGIEVELSSSIRRDAAAWIETHPSSRIFNAPEYCRVVAEITGGELCWLTAFRNGRVAGILHFIKKQDPEIGAIINSMPWFGSHGGCLLEDEDDHAARRALTQKFKSICDVSDTITATLVLTPSETRFSDEYVEQLAPLVQDTRIGQVTMLPQDTPELEERLMASVKQKTRNLIRKALSQDFTETTSGDEAAWRFLMETHQENLSAIGGISKPKAHFDIIREHIPPENVRLSVAWSGEEAVAALLLLTYGETVEYFTPTIKSAHRSKQPMSFLIWRAMNWAARSGYKEWNWGGTWKSQKSLHHFKAGWGAVDCEYRYLTLRTTASIEQISDNIDAISAAFPYFYIYPYDQLGGQF